MSVAEHFLTTAPAHLFMPDERDRRRRTNKQEWAELKDTAIAKLERRGYEVRGKTPAQIRQILKRHPTKTLPVSAV
jgi:hypothetical protein